MWSEKSIFQILLGRNWSCLLWTKHKKNYIDCDQYQVLIPDGIGLFQCPWQKVTNPSVMVVVNQKSTLKFWCNINCLQVHVFSTDFNSFFNKTMQNHILYTSQRYSWGGGGRYRFWTGLPSDLTWAAGPKWCYMVVQYINKWGKNYFFTLQSERKC